MNDKPPTPPLYPLSPPFPNMNGAKILVQRSAGSEIGTLVCYHKPDEGLFGIRIDVTKPPVFDYPPKPASSDEWETIGHIPVESLCLSEGAIRSIQKASSADYSFVVR